MVRSCSIVRFIEEVVFLRSVPCFCLLLTLLIDHAIPVGAVIENEVPELSDATLMPYFLKHFTPGVIKNRDGGDICYAKYEAAGAAGALVIVDGRTEFMAKYAEVFYDLRDTGFSFYIYDHRGQGESYRLLPDRQKGHIEHFDDYVEDLHLFLETVVKLQVGRTVFLLSHSMGGTISILHERKYPGTVSGIILCSPMFSVNTAPFPPLVAKIFCRVMDLLGFGYRYVPGGKPYDYHHPFENNDLTDSFARYELNRRRVEENPQVALGSPTILWLAEAFTAMGRIKADTTPLQIPMLLLVGEEDIVVGQHVQKKFCGIQPHCSFVALPHGKHELLMEKDQVRDVVLQHIEDFLQRHIAVGPIDSGPDAHH
jgi:lysophospholipase